jgi:bifunctional DNA-binding transcriptional regulator/antitoxin component of YhaV-PrlF toxin-antitoxin module
MAREVKRARERSGRRSGHTRVSSKHQVTIPRQAFETAGLNEGDVVRVEANGPGQVTLTRLDALLGKYRGALTPGAITNADIGRLRDEWP